jgi:TP901-1 family phage major tail protein
MAAQKGRDLLLKLSDGQPNPSFISVAGLRARTITLNADTVDVTDSDSAGWRELLAGAGVRSLSVSGSGLFRDAPSDALMRSAFFAQSHQVWQIIIPDFGRFEGPFIIDNLEYAGTHDGEASFALSISSAGEISFVAL